MKEVIGKLNEGLKDEDYKRSSINANHRIKNIKRFSKTKEQNGKRKIHSRKRLQVFTDT